MKRVILFIIFLLFIVPTITLADTTEKTPVNIKADEMERLTKEDRIIGKGNVKINYKNYSIDSDSADINLKSGEAVAKDNVTIRDNVMFSNINCDKTEFNINTKKGTIFNGAGSFNGEFFFSGKKIERIDEDKFNIYNGSFTTCIPEGTPSWQFRATKTYVQLEHYAHLQNPTFWIKKMPVLYFPYLIVPVKTKRATGLLMPDYGTSAKDGFLINNRFFWAINDWSDATVGVDYMAIKGVRPGLEFRYTPTENIEGKLYGNYLKEQDTNREFWKMTLEHRHSFSKGFNNITIVDIASKNNPDKEYGETLAERTKSIRDTYTSFTKNWSNSSLRLQIRYKKNVGEGADEKNYQLPTISFDNQDTRVAKTPFYLKSDSSYTFFVNDTAGSIFEMHRIDIHPTISLPVTALPYLNFTPSSSIRETFYSDGINENGNYTGPFSRETYDVNLRLEGPKFVKMFFDSNSEPKYKHLITPVVNYFNRPEFDTKDKNRIWYRTISGTKRIGFDGIDTIGPAENITYSLYNRILKKMPDGTREILRLEVSNSYDIRAAKGKNRQNSSTPLHPFSNIRVDLDSRIIDSVMLNMDGAYNVYDKKIDSANLELGLKYKSIWDFHIERRYTRKGSTFWTGTTGLTVYDSVLLSYSLRYDELKHTFADAEYKVKYSGQCWDLGFTYIDKKVFINNQVSSDTRYLFGFTLKGIGSFGDKTVRKLWYK